MVVVDQRVAQLLALVAEVIDRVRRLHALFDTQPLGHRAGNDVAYDHLQRNDRHPTAQLIAVIEFLEEVGLHAGPLQLAEDDRRDGVVDHPLVLDRRLLDVVEGRRGILVADDDPLGIVRAEDLLRLALVEHFELFHLS